jgi:hypothetical protein
MSVRRSARASPPPALPGTLCGPALALAPGVAPPRGTVATGGYLAYKKQKVKASTTRLDPVDGVVVEAAGNIYALRDDQGAYWWFDNVQVVEPYPTLAGPDKQVKDLDGNYVELSIFPFFDYVTYGEYFEEDEPKPRLNAQPGERVRFVPRETSTLLLKDGKLAIHEYKHGLAHIQYVLIPSVCKGVATETRPVVV